MRRPRVLYICLAFYSHLLLNGATQCLAFPKVERGEIAHAHEKRGQPERINTEDLENSPIASKGTPQPMVSEDPMIAGPSSMPLNEVPPLNKEAPSTGAGLVEPNSPGVHTATEPGVPAGEEVVGSSRPESSSPESPLPEATVNSPTVATGSWDVGEKEELVSSTQAEPTVEGTAGATTQDFLKSVDSRLFTTESQGGVSLGHSPSSYVNTSKILSTNPRAEKSEADTDPRITSLPGAEPIAGTEPGSLMSDRVKPSQMTAGDTQATATVHSPSVEAEADSLLGAPEVPVRVSTAVPTVAGDEWDDTKLERVSQIKTPRLGDNTETPMRTETSPTAQGSPNGVEGVEGGEALTEAAQRGLGLPEGEPHSEPAPLTARGEGRPSAFTDRVALAPTSPLEDTAVSVANLFQNSADPVEPTPEDDAMFSSETPVPISDYESEAHQPPRDAFEDTLGPEPRTQAVAEAAATLSWVTWEASPLHGSRGDGEAEEGDEVPSAASDVPGATPLPGRSEPLATAVSATAAPLSLEVTPAAEDLVDTVTGPKEELFTPVWGSPVTPPGIREEAPSISPALSESEASSERRTGAPSVSDVNTAVPYGLDQLESEEGEEDEEEEDEEEEDEEDEDEEEDDEEKDADSLDESLGGEPELRGFTFPGVTSQEPDLEQEGRDLLEGVTYPVPDALEWEQQNRGLVRSWMEKLKDKAGYMSGMLVPVGVGIAGALFILGALYSIKVMNRRRRNGFKRHKRKQREFNSMQDRVMLLADSSEDEF